MFFNRTVKLSSEVEPTTINLRTDLAFENSRDMERFDSGRCGYMIRVENFNQKPIWGL